MSTAVARLQPGPLVELAPAEAPAGFVSRLVALPVRTRLSLGIGLAALAGVVVALALWSGSGDFRPLYANLSDKDGGAVLAQLTQMNVPYRLGDGGTVLVPAAQLHDVRLKLASAGLPKGSVAGFEQMDSARYGQTQFQERLTFQRGLEGELTRSIVSLAAVQNARVHLAMPNQNGFFREQQKPSASVLLTLHPGRMLDRAQIAGIVHLVASSVAELSPKAVSVLDQSGALLSGPVDGTGAGGLDEQQLKYVSQVEQGYSKRSFDLLEPVVGRDNLRTTVAADIDFSQVEQTSEEFRPNQGEQAQRAVRSQQSSDQSGAGAAPATGVPGAASNQPPQTATAPIVGASAPLQTAQTGAGGGTTRRDATTNFEVDKTVRVTKNASGTVKRLNAAVVVNHRSATDAKGKTTAVPLTPDEIEKLTALVREGIGFNKERGDSVKVINAPFRVTSETIVDVPWWKQPSTLDLVRAAAVPTALAAVALAVVFALVRPALKAAQAQAQASVAEPVGQTLNAVVDGDDGLADPAALAAPAALPAIEPPRSQAQLEQARQMVKANPAAVAGIVRDWVNGTPVAEKASQ